MRSAFFPRDEGLYDLRKKKGMLKGSRHGEGKGGRHACNIQISAFESIMTVVVVVRGLSEQQGSIECSAVQRRSAWGGLLYFFR